MTNVPTRTTVCKPLSADYFRHLTSVDIDDFSCHDSCIFQSSFLFGSFGKRNLLWRAVRRCRLLLSYSLVAFAHVGQMPLLLAIVAGQLLLRAASEQMLMTPATVARIRWARL